tara:strand:- start:7002 stop:7379 length:378 start_codon:yes stop_codon:yes gene_type:complete
MRLYQPLPDSLTIKNSSIQGLGLFATKKIPVGTTLGISHVRHDDYQDGFIGTALGSFYNHSDNPNTKSVSAYLKDLKGNETTIQCRELITIKNINPGDEITCNYSLWDKSAWRLQLLEIMEINNV